MINGRPICLFKLAEPVCVAHWRFHIVELPWPGESVIPMKAGSISKSSCPRSGNLKCPALALLADDGLSQPGIVVKPARRKGA